MIVGKIPFVFFNMWCQHTQFMEIVQHVWPQSIMGSEMFKVVSKLKALKKELKLLNNSQFGDVSVFHSQTYHKLLEAKKILHNQPDDLNLRAQEADARAAYRTYHKNYTSFMSQKAKIRWLTEGNDNTSIFHQSIQLRRIQNKNNTIRREDGMCLHNSDEVVGTFLDFIVTYQGVGKIQRRQRLLLQLRVRY